MSIFAPLCNIVKTVIESVGKVPVQRLFLKLLMTLPSIIETVSFLMRKNKTDDEMKQIIDDAMLEFDNHTGREGLTLIPDMPIDKIEEALDHFKEFARIVCYHAAGLYKDHIPTEEQ